jgi:hypothetical protein
MELTQEQFDFFKDLDFAAAVKHGEGRVQFTFTHKDRGVTVRPRSSGKGDIVVRLGTSEEDRLLVDLNLSLWAIEGTENMDGRALLNVLYDAVNNPGPGLLKAIWLDTPYVKAWSVDVLGSHIRFLCQKEPVTYELHAYEAPGIQETTAVELLVDGERVHTFLLPMGYGKPTAQFLLKLANAITGAWYAEVRSDCHE